MQTSRTTVRQALSELVVEGRLVRRQGSGTYVAEPKITWPLYLASFTEQVEASGFTPSSEVLGTQRVAASADLARQLGLAPRAPVYKIERLRFADAWPIAVETSWLLGRALPGTDAPDPHHAIAARDPRRAVRDAACVPARSRSRRRPQPLARRAR